MRPYERLPDTVTYNGKTYKLDMSYSAFFAVSDLMQDETLLDSTKLSAALDILVRSKHPEDPELLSAVYELIRDDRPKPDGPKAMDIEQDWGYICAAFQQAYGINLYEDKTMHILRFRALLEGLPKNTRLAEIVGIRTAKIPKPTKYNAEQIADLTRLKAIYALRGNEESLQEGFAKLFSLLEARAKKNA